MKAAGWFLLLLPVVAVAHQGGTSYSSWDFTAAAPTLSVRVAEVDLTRHGLDPRRTAGYDGRVMDLLSDRIRLEIGGKGCAPEASVRQLAADGWRQYRWTWQCPAQSDTPIRITSRFLHDHAPGHLHMARVRLDPDGPWRDRVLTSASADWVISDPDDGGSKSASGFRFFITGVEHIVTGWDHLAFVAALLLLTAGLGERVWLVTGFTLGHSLTLALVVLGLVQPQGHLVEVLIAWSILLLAVEALFAGRQPFKAAALPAVAGLAAALPLLNGQLPWQAAIGMLLFSVCYFSLLHRLPRPYRLRMLITLGFGLVHGCGFAALLMEIGIAEDRRGVALLGFNLGVEAGQLAWVVILIGAGAVLRRLHPASSVARHGLAATALLALGVHWFVIRSFALAV